MGEPINDVTRLALFQAWHEKCVWCQTPLAFNEMEVEHLLPKSLAGTERTKVLQAHGLEESFDLDALENMAPSCRSCNGRKGKRTPPVAPLITTLLDTANRKAPDIRDASEKLTSSRRVATALTVLGSAARSGDATATEGLRAAARELETGFKAATGQRILRPDSVLAQLKDQAEYLRGIDEAFSYPLAMYESQGPRPPLTPGTVMSMMANEDGFTSRIDVVPKSDDAMERYGPSFTLTTTDDEAGNAAKELLDEALNEGIAVEINEGVAVHFDRLPPGLDHMTERPISGRVVLTPTPTPAPPVPDWHAVLRMTSQPKRSAVRVILRATDDTPTGRDALTGAFAGLRVAATFKRDGASGELRWSLSHEQSSAPIGDQLLTMELLTAMAHGGELLITDVGRARRPEIRIQLDPSEPPPAAKAFLALLRDLRSIEEWTGEEISLPDEISTKDVRHVALIANTLRNGGREITWSELSAEVAPGGVEQLQQGGTLRIVHRGVSALVLGQEVPLGRVERDIAGYVVDTVGPTDADTGYQPVRLVPQDEGAADVFERLVREKKSKRPPPPPRKAAKKRRKERARRTR